MIRTAISTTAIALAFSLAGCGASGETDYGGDNAYTAGGADTGGEMVTDTSKDGGVGVDAGAAEELTDEGSGVGNGSPAAEAKGDGGSFGGTGVESTDGNEGTGG